MTPRSEPLWPYCLLQGLHAEGIGDLIQIVCQLLRFLLQLLLSLLLGGPPSDRGLSELFQLLGESRLPLRQLLSVAGHLFIGPALAVGELLKILRCRLPSLGGLLPIVCGGLHAAGRKIFRSLLSLLGEFPRSLCRLRVGARFELSTQCQVLRSHRNALLLLQCLGDFLRQRLLLLLLLLLTLLRLSLLRLSLLRLSLLRLSLLRLTLLRLTLLRLTLLWLTLLWLTLLRLTLLWLTLLWLSIHRLATHRVAALWFSSLRVSGLAFTGIVHRQLIGIRIPRLFGFVRESPLLGGQFTSPLSQLLNPLFGSLPALRLSILRIAAILRFAP